MKVLKIDHIGIAVKSIDEAKNLYSGLLGLNHEGSETVAEQKLPRLFSRWAIRKSSFWSPPRPTGRLPSILKKR